jgi:hypothetical protein
LCNPEPKDRDNIPLLEGKSSYNWFGWNLPPQATHYWLFDEVAQLLIGLTQISFVKKNYRTVL